MATKKKTILDPKQQAFLEYYVDPKSSSFSNAKESALKAGYSKEYAKNITGQMPDWLSENISRMQMLSKAERNLNQFLDEEKDLKVKADITKFVAKTVGKDVYSERTEHTGKDGDPIEIDIESASTVELLKLLND